MKSHRSWATLGVSAAVALAIHFAAGSSSELAAAPKLKLEELIEKHLESLGGTEALRSFHHLRATGRGAFIPKLGGTGRLDGTASIYSADTNWRLQLKFDNPQFPGENFSFDDGTVDVEQLRPGVRSPLGQLLYSQDRPLTEGLLGGTLSTGWALLNVAERDPKLKYAGLKKVDGAPLHTLEYRPKKGTDLKIRLFFEPDTYRHVRTEYRMTISAASVRLGSGGEQLPENRFEIVEEFSDFRAKKGLTLPHSYRIRYMAEGQSSVLLDYEMSFDQIEVD